MNIFKDNNYDDTSEETCSNKKEDFWKTGYSLGADLSRDDDFCSSKNNVENNEETNDETKNIGIVDNCLQLIIRIEPSKDSKIIGFIDKLSKVEILEEINDFYKICTESGIEGFCMKDYIKI